MLRSTPGTGVFSGSLVSGIGLSFCIEPKTGVITYGRVWPEWRRRIGFRGTARGSRYDPIWPLLVRGEHHGMGPRVLGLRSLLSHAFVRRRLSDTGPPILRRPEKSPSKTVHHSALSYAAEAAQVTHLNSEIANYTLPGSYVPARTRRPI
jgi:hypothetical protein